MEQPKKKVALVVGLWLKRRASTENALIPVVSTSTGFENSAKRPNRVSS